MGLAWEIGGAGLAVHGEKAGVRRAWQVGKVKLACWSERGDLVKNERQQRA